jgi:hypothetical protein
MSTGQTTAELDERIAVIRQNTDKISMSWSNRPLLTPVPEVKIGQQTESRSRAGAC